jgi:cytoplasmic iron level regulating protein YaaA (DUF328/UPF0246 family)
MIALLSPSKNLHNDPQATVRYSLPRFPEQSSQLIKTLVKLKPEELQKLMHINEKLASLNYHRYRAYQWPHTSENATAAIYTFRGEVYLGFEAGTMTKTQTERADKHIRILSGLYGLLKPLDLIQPYRLEMGSPLKVGRAKDLYSFWGDRITHLLNEDIAATKSKAVINLASKEYIAAIDPAKLSVPMVDIHFLENRNGQLKFLSYNAKRSRGWMARYIVDQNIKTVSAIRGFDWHDYAYREDLSESNKMVFVR